MSIGGMGTPPGPGWRRGSHPDRGDRGQDHQDRQGRDRPAEVADRGRQERRTAHVPQPDPTGSAQDRQRLAQAAITTARPCAPAPRWVPSSSPGPSATPSTPISAAPGPGVLRRSTPESSAVEGHGEQEHAQRRGHDLRVPEVLAGTRPGSSSRTPRSPTSAPTVTMPTVDTVAIRSPARTAGSGQRGLDPPEQLLVREPHPARRRRRTLRATPASPTRIARTITSRA